MSSQSVRLWLIQTLHIYLSVYFSLSASFTAYTSVTSLWVRFWWNLVEMLELKIIQLIISIHIIKIGLEITPLECYYRFFNQCVRFCFCGIIMGMIILQIWSFQHCKLQSTFSNQGIGISWRISCKTVKITTTLLAIRRLIDCLSITS